MEKAILVRFSKLHCEQERIEIRSIAEPKTLENTRELRFRGRYTAVSDIFLQEVPKARSWENFLGHLELWGDETGG